MKISNEINQLNFKRLVFLNPTDYKKYVNNVKSILVPKTQLPKKLEISSSVRFKKILVSFFQKKSDLQKYVLKLFKL